MSIIRTGAPGPTLKARDLTWQRGQGFRSRLVYRGTRDECIAQFSNVSLGAQTVSMIQEGDSPMCTLETTFGNAMDGSQNDQANLLTEIWTLDGNDLEKPIFSHAKFQALTTVEQQALRDYESQQSKATTAITSSDGLLFLVEIKKKTQGYTISQYVLRRVQTIDPAWTSQIDATNANNYYSSTANLLAAEPNIPTIIIPTFPAGMWLKRTPKIQQQSNGKYEATQEWWHADSWSSLFYNLAT